MVPLELKMTGHAEIFGREIKSCHNLDQEKRAYNYRECFEDVMRMRV